MLLSSPQTKTQYSELEAAVELGVTIEQLHSLIRTHIVDQDMDLSSLSVSNLHSSDLLVLKILSSTTPARAD
jgi:hypothetical protein